MQILIVDDERLACERLRTLLATEHDIEIAGECHDGRSAVDAIQKLKPELVFLDVQMPELDGFGVLAQLRDAPAIIFVTAFDQFAIRAFEVHALDYLLKPFDRERFAKALERGREEVRRRAASDLDQRLRSLLDEVSARRKYVDRLVVRASGRVLFVHVDELDWVEAAGNYVRLHTGAESHLYRETMSNLENALDPAKFARIHRSTIVNVARVKELHPLFRGDHQVVLRDGTALTLSKNFRDRLKF